jgi:hypothetical protein
LKEDAPWDESEIQWTHGETLKDNVSGYEIDLHWDIMSYRVFGCRFEFDELWQRRNIANLQGKEIPSPSLEDLFLILCIHGCKHRWIMLKWIRDITLLSNLDSEVDWKLLRRRAARMGATRMVALGLNLVHELLGATPPEAATREFPADRTVRSLAREVRSYIVAGMDYGPAGRGRHRFYLRMRERLRDRVRYSVRLAKRLPDPTRWHVALPAFFSLLFALAWPLWSLKRGTVRVLTQLRSRS